jgi:hypothetical protein
MLSEFGSGSPTTNGKSCHWNGAPMLTDDQLRRDFEALENRWLWLCIAAWLSGFLCGLITGRL